MKQQHENRTVPQFEITYSETCPTCKLAGVSSVLGLVLGVGIVCETEQHFFEELPSETAASSAPFGLVEMEGETACDSLTTSAETLEQSETSAAEPAGEGERLSEASVIEQTQEPESPDVAGGPAANESAKPSAGDLPQSLAVEVAEVPNLPLWEPLAFRGGSALVLVEIPESFFVGMQAEAEAQHLPFAVFLRDWMQRASENQWT